MLPSHKHLEKVSENNHPYFKARIRNNIQHAGKACDVPLSPFGPIPRAVFVVRCESQIDWQGLLWVCSCSCQSLLLRQSQLRICIAYMSQLLDIIVFAWMRRWVERARFGWLEVINLLFFVASHGHNATKFKEEERARQYEGNPPGWRGGKGKHAT